jgi:hypothetical protein
LTQSILWRRLDVPGHDACRLEQGEAGWKLAGAAVFEENGLPACLRYEVECAGNWHTQHGQVHGWVGPYAVAIHITRSEAGNWTLNGRTMAGLEHCVDLDLGFTPATNLLTLRRLSLSIGEAADVSAAWLDASADVLALLPQRYERRSETTYWYEARRFDYAALLEVDPTGFIHRYPGLWEAES